MHNDKTLALICELASWNGRLSAAIEIALISIKHAALESGVDTLAMVLRDYQEYRDAQYFKLVGRAPTKSDEIAYENKHSDVGEPADAPTFEDAS